MMHKIKRDDEVIVIAGRDKGKTGRVVKVLAQERALVSGVHKVKRHTRPNPQKGIAGGIVEKEAPIAVSNLALLNPNTGKADRVGFRVAESGKKVRYFKSDNTILDQ